MNERVKYMSMLWVSACELGESRMQSPLSVQGLWEFKILGARTRFYSDMESGSFSLSFNVHTNESKISVHADTFNLPNG